MTLSDFEKQRQENIQRNKELLRQLELDSLNDSITREVPKPKPKAKRRKTENGRVKNEPIMPTRRSRRIAGSTMEDSEEDKQMREEMEKAEERKRELEKLKLTRLFGDFKLIDLVVNKQGEFKNQDRVLRSKQEDNIKKEDNQKIDNDEIKKEDPATIDLSRDNEVLQKLQQLGDRFSVGDFYDMIKDTNLKYDDAVLQEKRKEFDKLKLYERFDPLDIKITQQRITSIAFHPAKDDRVVVAGDTTGYVGIWAVDSKGDEETSPHITILKPHGKAVARILTPEQQPSSILTCSYDGSVRRLDLKKLESTEVAYLQDPNESSDYPLGVSDINVADNNVLYMTTLSGNFYRYDMRTPFKQGELLRLHDKKIGSFSINPNASHQIATASLDRSMKLWDLRNISQKNSYWSEYDDKSPHLYCTYHSRLSVSCVDWNHDNHLVCNGYDDTVNVFDLSGSDKLPLVTEWSKDYETERKKRTSIEDGVPEKLEALTRIKHNCQTGRWVSILKSKWQLHPGDGLQKFVIANMNRAFDIYDQKGRILCHLTDPDRMTAVPAVSMIHPTQNWCVGGSASGKVYLFE